MVTNGKLIGRVGCKGPLGLYITPEFQLFSYSIPGRGAHSKEGEMKLSRHLRVTAQ
jgi:hypothetical protein